jgi:hypothetical protein
MICHQLGGFVVWEPNLSKVAAAGTACVPEYWKKKNGM